MGRDHSHPDTPLGSGLRRQDTVKSGGRRFVISNAPARRVRRPASTPARKPRSRRHVSRRRGLSRRTRLILGGIALLAALFIWTAIARAFAPAGNTAATRFDAIIVLGTPADSEGYPTPDQLSRVTEAVHEYERGVAPRLILTGGPAHNQFVEAEVMARTAQAQGVPPSALVIEPQAHDTLQNACYSARIMKSHGWHSAEVISTAAQQTRAALIFNRLPLDWRTHTAPSLEPGNDTSSTDRPLEFLKTLRMLVYGRWAESCSL